MKLFDNKPYRVPITTDLKSKARSAHANYFLRLGAEEKAQAQAKKDEENRKAEKKSGKTNKKKSVKRRMISLAKVPNLQ